MIPESQFPAHFQYCLLTIISYRAHARTSLPFCRT